MSFELLDLARDVGNALYNFFSHRILWLLVVTAVLFYVLIAQLFRLQIVEADTFTPEPPRTATVTRPIPATRGTIYDRHGRPLAVNQLSFVVKMDPSVEISNEALLELALLFERNGERFVDDFPISREEPFEFLFTGSEDSIRRQAHRWKDDMAVPNPWYATAEETWEFLRSPNNRFLRLDPELSNEDARRILNFRAPIFMQRLHNWDTYMPIPIIFAYDVSHETIAAISENNALFTGLFVDTQTMRYYPAGRYMSHMIGYLRQILPAQLAENEHLGYTAFDLFGRAGLELSMEHFLRGQPGLQSFDVNAAGRRISTPVWDVEPQPGNSVFLTIDLALQQQVFHIMEHYLSEVLIRRLLFTPNTDHHISIEEVLANFVRGYHFDVRRLLEVEADNHAFWLQQYILERFPGATATRDSIREIQRYGLIPCILAGRITPAQMLLALIGTEQISDIDGTIAELLIEDPNSALDVLIEKIHARELTPHMLNADPSTGSAVIVCVHTGEVLAAVTYPSFDNNRLVNDFDNEYWRHISQLDPTEPMRNRPFMESIAPGSTFKMFTAVAALEYAVIGPTTRIYDAVHFTRAGTPGIRCWHSGHGSLTVCRAIAVSCNYFFAESAWRLGNSSAGTTMQGIERLNGFMEFFGLNSPTGVQIGERHLEFARTGYDGNQMASPDLKVHMGMIQNPFSSRAAHRWTDMSTAQVSFGQGLNAYTAAQMARGMMTIANRGNSLPLTLVGHVENNRGATVMRHQPAPEFNDITVSDSTWDVVFEGMRLVTQPGAGGTGVNVFRDLQGVVVAGKTGTAEHGLANRFSHTAFGGFAPYDDPQVAIYVKIPFGSTSAYNQLSARIARDLFELVLSGNGEPERPEPTNNLRV